MRIRQILAIAASALLAVFVVAAPAQAGSGGTGSPHFIYITPQLAGNDLQVNFKEAGVGAGATVYVSASATFSFTLGCINGGSNHPKASNKTAFSDTVSVPPHAFTATSGGNVISSLTVPAPSMSVILANLICPPGQTTTLIVAQWDHLVVTDTSNSITVNVPGTWAVF